MSRSNGRPKSNAAMSADLYHLLVSSITDCAIVMLDPEGRVASWSAGAQAISGYTADEIVGSHFSRFYPDDVARDGWPEHELRTAAETGRFEDEGWRIRKDGSRFWAHVVITAMRDGKGELKGYSKVTRDLTERRQQEDALRQSEERFRSLVESVTDYAIFLLDPRGFVTTWNAGARQIKGYEAHEIIGSHFSRFYPPDAVQRRWPEHELKMATMEGRFEDEAWRVRKDGSRFWANVIITALRDINGELIGFSKITRDLTERRRQAEAVRQSEERLRLLIEGVDEYAIFMLDAQGLVSSWNSGATRITGYSVGEILGKHYSGFYRAEEIAASKPWHELAAARYKGRQTEEGWRLRKDGSVFWASTSLTAMHDHDGQFYGFATVTQDLTRKRHSAALEDAAQRMQEFVAMLAHELRNPLAPIRNAVSLMGRKGLADPTLEAMRQTIERQSAHLARIIDELLDVNRIARGKFLIERRPIDLADVLARAIEASRTLIDARGHTFRAELPQTTVHLLGDAVRLTQMLVNLLNNAAKYTKEGGQISLAVIPRDRDVEIRVRDSGRGLAPETLNRVFDLFVQLNPCESDMQGGIGVGLAIVRRVAELHGGTVEARSEGLGRGSEFIVRLPVSGAPPREVAGAAPPATHSATRLRVLVVDDNADAADSLAMLLDSMGQETHTVYDGMAAVAAVETFRPQVVLLDIGMPHMNGYEVARRIASGRDGAHVVLAAVTGWGQESDMKRAREAGFERHFVKPVSERALVRLLEDVAAKTKTTKP